MVNASFTVDDHAAYVAVEREKKLNTVDTPTKEKITDPALSVR